MAPRPIRVEDELGARLIAEREARGLTYRALADLMTAAGCPTRPSAIQKMEKGVPRRRIVVDEAAALSTVFNIPIATLLTSRKDVARERLTAALRGGPAAAVTIAVAQRSYAGQVETAARHLADHGLNDADWQEFDQSISRRRPRDDAELAAARFHTNVLWRRTAILAEAAAGRRAADGRSGLRVS